MVKIQFERRAAILLKVGVVTPASPEAIVQGEGMSYSSMRRNQGMVKKLAAGKYFPLPTNFPCLSSVLCG